MNQEMNLAKLMALQIALLDIEILKHPNIDNI